MIPAPLLQSTDPASALGEPDPDGIYRIDETDSVLTLARSLYAADRLPVYGSIFANLQTAGRGQYGRAWESARGNLHAGIRLPLEGVYATRASAAATAALTAEALRSLGFPVLMKWPNDIICLSPNGPAKVGGILLEESDGLLTAGIGLNVNWSPEVSSLREGAALPPGRLVPAGEPQWIPMNFGGAFSVICAKPTPFGSPPPGERSRRLTSFGSEATWRLRALRAP